VNTAVLINGVPVNDMENGRVFWSNWTGLADVASAMQVQRGLGASKLAISSVGGTLNIVTKTTDLKEGGFFGTTVANANYLKTVASYSTGRMDNGFAFTTLLSRTAGNGYIDGTQFDGYNYFFGFGWSDDAHKHNVQFTITGAPQVHNQRTTSFFNMATIEDYLEHGTRYNYNHGYLEGKAFNWRQNFYHKPVAAINWDWNISDNSKLSTVLYASYGRGGGTGDIGRADGSFPSSSKFRDENGLVRWDAIKTYNAGGSFQRTNGDIIGPRVSYSGIDGTTVTAFDGQFLNTNNGDSPFVDDESYVEGSENGLTRRASINSHNWFGGLANFNHQLNDNFAFDVGVDLRTYKGFHYRRIDNLLGADGYIDNDNINNLHNVTTATYSSDFSSIVNVFKDIDDEEKIDYYNIGYVNWAGVFGQLEYKNDVISAFLQFGASNQGFRREDFYNYTDNASAAQIAAEGAPQLTDWQNFLGGNIKAGANWNINEQHNIFVNAGYYSKQPLFDAVFLDRSNEINEDVQNEKILGTEIGYGFRAENANLNVNLYRTSWKNRYQNAEDNNSGSANIQGIEQIHMGIELEGSYQPFEFLRFNGMLSVGNWEYGGTPSGPAFDSGNNPLPGQTVTLYLDGIKVGNAAQTTSRLSATITPVERVKFDFGWFRADQLYADFSIEDFNEADNDGSLQLPSYNLFDAGFSYKMLLGDQKTKSLSFRLNIQNLFDTEYLVESATNIHSQTEDDFTTAADYQNYLANDTYEGIDAGNKAFFGWGINWNASIRYNF